MAEKRKPGQGAWRQQAVTPSQQLVRSTMARFVEAPPAPQQARAFTSERRARLEANIAATLAEARRLRWEISERIDSGQRPAG